MPAMQSTVLRIARHVLTGDEPDKPSLTNLQNDERVEMIIREYISSKSSDFVANAEKYQWWPLQGIDKQHLH